MPRQDATYAGYNNGSPPVVRAASSIEQLNGSDTYIDALKLSDTLVSFDYVVLNDDTAKDFTFTLRNITQDVEQMFMGLYMALSPSETAEAKGFEESDVRRWYIQWGYESKKLDKSDAPTGEDVIALSKIHTATLYSVDYKFNTANERMVVLKFKSQAGATALRQQSANTPTTFKVNVLDDDLSFRLPSDVIAEMLARIGNSIPGHAAWASVNNGPGKEIDIKFAQSLASVLKWKPYRDDPIFHAPETSAEQPWTRPWLAERGMVIGPGDAAEPEGVQILSDLKITEKVLKQYLSVALSPGLDYSFIDNLYIGKKDVPPTFEQVRKVYSSFMRTLGLTPIFATGDSEDAAASRTAITQDPGLAAGVQEDVVPQTNAAIQGKSEKFIDPTPFKVQVFEEGRRPVTCECRPSSDATGPRTELIKGTSLDFDPSTVGEWRVFTNNQFAATDWRDVHKSRFRTETDEHYHQVVPYVYDRIRVPNLNGVEKTKTVWRSLFDWNDHTGTNFPWQRISYQMTKKEARVLETRWDKEEANRLEVETAAREKTDGGKKPDTSGLENKGDFPISFDLETLETEADEKLNMSITYSMKAGESSITALRGLISRVNTLCPDSFYNLQEFLVDFSYLDSKEVRSEFFAGLMDDGWFAQDDFDRYYGIFLICSPSQKKRVCKVFTKNDFNSFPISVTDLEGEVKDMISLSYGYGSRRDGIISELHLNIDSTFIWLLQSTPVAKQFAYDHFHRASLRSKDLEMPNPVLDNILLILTLTPAGEQSGGEYTTRLESLLVNIAESAVVRDSVAFSNDAAGVALEMAERYLAQPSAFAQGDSPEGSEGDVAAKYQKAASELAVQLEFLKSSEAGALSEVFFPMVDAGEISGKYLIDSPHRGTPGIGRCTGYRTPVEMFWTESFDFGERVKKLIIQKVQAFDKLRSVLVNIDVKTLGIPELDNLGDLGSKLVYLKVANQRITSQEDKLELPTAEHWMTGYYYIRGISHSISQGGYSTNLILYQATTQTAQGLYKGSSYVTKTDAELQDMLGEHTDSEPGLSNAESAVYQESEEST